MTLNLPTWSTLVKEQNFSKTWSKNGWRSRWCRRKLLVSEIDLNQSTVKKTLKAYNELLKKVSAQSVLLCALFHDYSMLGEHIARKLKTLDGMCRTVSLTVSQAPLLRVVDSSLYTFLSRGSWPIFLRSRTSWRDRVDAGQLDTTDFTLRTSWRKNVVLKLKSLLQML